MAVLEVWVLVVKHQHSLLTASREKPTSMSFLGLSDLRLSKNHA